MQWRCSAQWASPEVSSTKSFTQATANRKSTGIEEALVGTMVEQESFIADFRLNDMGDDHRAEVVGNVVSMSQLGCIAGALS